VLALNTTTRRYTVPPVRLGIGSKYARRPAPFGAGAEPYRVVNLFYEVDTPGEYAIDFPARQLLYHIPANFDPASTALTTWALPMPLINIVDSTNLAIVGLDIAGVLGDGLHIVNSSGINVRACVYICVSVYVNVCVCVCVCVWRIVREMRWRGLPGR
jgi:hypothetical protein